MPAIARCLFGALSLLVGASALAQPAFQLYATCTGGVQAGACVDPVPACTLSYALLQATSYSQPVDLHVASGTCVLDGQYVFGVASRVRVLGAGRSATRIDMSQTVQAPVLLVSGGALWLDALTIQNSVGFAVGVLNGSLRTNDAVFDNNRGNFGTSIAGTNAVVEVFRTSFTANIGGLSGAIAVEGSGSLTIIESAFEGNSGQGLGGAIFTSGPPVSISRSLFVQNTSATMGGALYLGGTSASIWDSTFVQNQAASGGAIAIDSSFTNAGVRLFGTTFDANTASAGGSAVFGTGNIARVFDVSGSLISGACAGMAAGAVSTGSVESPGDTCGLGAATNRVGISAAALLLGPLADNGGPTRTRVPQAGSVLVGIGPGACDGTDQRARVRNQGACDVGAVEVGATLEVVHAGGFE